VPSYAQWTDIGTRSPERQFRRSVIISRETPLLLCGAANTQSTTWPAELCCLAGQNFDSKAQKGPKNLKGSQKKFTSKLCQIYQNKRLSLG
jgi:hypothetical protein